MVILLVVFGAPISGAMLLKKINDHAVRSEHALLSDVHGGDTAGYYESEASTIGHPPSDVRYDAETALGIPFKYHRIDRYSRFAGDRCVTAFFDEIGGFAAQLKVTSRSVTEWWTWYPRERRKAYICAPDHGRACTVVTTETQHCTGPCTTEVLERAATPLVWNVLQNLQIQHTTRARFGLGRVTADYLCSSVEIPTDFQQHSRPLRQLGAALSKLTPALTTCTIALTTATLSVSVKQQVRGRAQFGQGPQD